jgi:hypothetical protein
VDCSCLGHCSTGGFDIRGVNPLGSTTRQLVVVCEEGNWIQPSGGL